MAWYWWRATWRTAWRPALVVVLLTGLLGAVSMAALAGARRTESAYGRYLQSVRASDVMVNIPSPDTVADRQGGASAGRALECGLAGLDANPVVRGRVDDSFLTDSVESSVDGAFYRQDTLTVLSGRLPRPTSSNEIALTPGIARLFGVGVGGTVRYQLYDAATQKAIGVASFRVTAVVEAPPALVDQFDEQEGAFLVPGGHGPLRTGDRLLVGGNSTGPGNRRPAVIPVVPHAPVDAASAMATPSRCEGWAPCTVRCRTPSVPRPSPSRYSADWPPWLSWCWSARAWPSGSNARRRRSARSGPSVSPAAMRR